MTIFAILEGNLKGIERKLSQLQTKRPANMEKREHRQRELDWGGRSVQHYCVSVVIHRGGPASNATGHCRWKHQWQVFLKTDLSSRAAGPPAAN